MCRLLLLLTLFYVPLALAAGGDPMQNEIIGLHIGMTREQARARLMEQGYPINTDTETIVSRTPDGYLTLGFASGLVNEIRYALFYRTSGARESMARAVTERFGVPDQASPMTWCSVLQPDGTCSHNRPYMTFDLKTMTLVLLAGGD